MQQATKLNKLNVNIIPRRETQTFSVGQATPQSNQLCRNGITIPALGHSCVNAFEGEGKNVNEYLLQRIAQ